MSISTKVIIKLSILVAGNNFELSINEILQILSIKIFDKESISQLFDKPNLQNFKEQNYIQLKINKELPSGVHAIDFDGSPFPGEIYFYILQVDDYLLMRKMVLLT